MESTTDIKRINTINTYLKDYFGEKVIKLAIDGNFTCPNRDGTKGFGGCIFCSPQGSGDMASNVEDQIALLSKKWPNANKYIAYFQSHTNTYAPVSILRKKFYKALENPNVIGLAIATRPDCLDEDILELLEELSQKTFLWVELGLQSIHEKTGILINRCHPLSDYDEAVVNLKKRNIPIVTHLIFGLPGESKEEMLQSVRYVRDDIFGIKIHLLNVVKGSRMEGDYKSYTPFASIDEYIDLVTTALTLIPWHVTVHRLTGDVPRKTLISPPWSYKKRTILNGIAHKLRDEGLVQGCSYLGSNLPSL